MIQILIQILIFIMLLGVIPFLVGGMFVREGEEGVHFAFRWVSGQMFIWAGFQIICVPLILFQKHNNFRYLCILFGGFLASSALLALGVWVRRRKGPRAPRAEAGSRETDKTALFLWLPVCALVVLQQVLAVTMAYEEGDDAFYVATAVVTESSDTMYQILPYTGFATGLDVRHGLAPFPIWAAFLSRLSGVHAATVSQIVLPVVLIAMAYSVFYLAGRKLVGDHRRSLPLFMLFIEIMVMFGGQSLYTSENFLLVRTAQGKAVLASIVIPFLLLLLLLAAERLQQNEKVGFWIWLLFGATMISGSLCSTQGALLTCLLAGAGGICTALCYRRWKILLPAAACCVVPMSFAVLYLLLD